MSQNLHLVLQRLARPAALRTAGVHKLRVLLTLPSSSPRRTLSSRVCTAACGVHCLELEPLISEQRVQVVDTGGRTICNLSQVDPRELLLAGSSVLANAIHHQVRVVPWDELDCDPIIGVDKLVSLRLHETLDPGVPI
eukprot:CAMPEP_0181209878 /NCGR_PEP_ID=MMETSP1096-20121128/22922_1 /TAXON_ID=156174 ORGANISM="Chrysochromulina ericina, Strain CCMP281" /NCGR_SAMPLE_ID=MMETSP1096 /ASSEMBLY_ACC=CAM_ASM_000453 /LENGTH=137 /DNA_ID=CAMNT_0023301111 /DNA_START=204 /DNA_END=617 /DNA_ORIENTATION=+